MSSYRAGGYRPGRWSPLSHKTRGSPQRSRGGHTKFLAPALGFGFLLLRSEQDRALLEDLSNSSSFEVELLVLRWICSLKVRGGKGPIFEDGPSFETAFKLFHGQDGVVPLSGGSVYNENSESNPVLQFNPLAGNAASISLSAFGPEGSFGFNFFSRKWKKKNKKSSKSDNISQKGGGSSHEARSSEWLESGQCPIAKSYRAVSRVLPLVTKALQPPPGMKLRCPPAIVAARAALAQTALVKNLRPQPLPSKMLAIALLGMAANIPLGVWREHTGKFSPQWFVAVHAAVPFIAMLRKSVLMPKTAMALTIAASILGQTIGSRAELLPPEGRKRCKWWLR
ncbi:hypothetical protein J5N97_029515 [Dioscorea zingiberensis]|uniref:Uncharacterized protein n=1 Tax=Dioscorea zingiberensis TaxID=325984 RepID=A0A9D5C1R1_9LILI|nr:hypothetical protein J5N97_029515 [Dioscorea zingiberensis]